MYPFYSNVPPPAHHSHYPPQFTSVVPYASAAPHGAIPYGQSSHTSDEDIKKRYTDSDRKLHKAMSRIHFPTPEHGQQCSTFVQHLRIHRNLFMHTYVHLVSCCRGRYLHRLVEEASRWKGWDSVEQLIHHSLIREGLLSFWQEHPCHEHKALRDRHFEIGDDDSDLLCHLLYCGKKREMYGSSNHSVIRGHVLQGSEQVIELLWQFLIKTQEIHDLRRLRAFIYRMARKSAYLPRALWIAPSSISRRRDLGSGAHGLVTRAVMNDRDVAIKKIVCSDPAAQRKCLEMFASEAILWGTLRHKNIVPFLGVVEDTFNMGLVSPFFKYGNIRVYLKGRDPREWPGLARKWARNLAKALAYIHCHEPPVIHGDLKGDNVLVDDSGNACLSDFGQSYASDSGKYLDSTRVGLVAYNPVHWMAPELIEGGDRAKASDKSDVYAFGCVLYEMVVGRVPFEGLAFGDVVRYVRDDTPPTRPRSLPENDPLWRIIMSCRQRRPEARPSTTHLVSLLR